MTVRFVRLFAVSLLLTSVASAQNAGPAPAASPVPSPVVGSASPAVAVSRPAAPAAKASATDASKDYRIGVGDELEVWVFDQKDLSRKVPVRPDGKISLPFVNDIVAAGRSAADLGTEISERLKPYVQNPVVSVMLSAVRSARATVSGAVRMPNSYELRPGETVMDLIGRGQGFTEFANRKDIVLIRAKDGERIKLNWDRMRDGKDPNPIVEPGDIIIVND